MAKKLKYGKKRHREERRYKRSMSKLRANDMRLAKMYDGHVLSAAAILKIFGYSPNTYINDTRLKSNKIIRKVSKDKFRIVVPHA